MATYHAIAATSEAVCGLLKSAASTSEFADVHFDIYQAANFQKSPEHATVSIYLYRVAVSAARRNLPPRLGLDGLRRRSPILLDLHYMLTAWAQNPVRQQRLLGWCIRIIEDTLIFPAGLLNHAGDKADVFRPDETVEFVLESPSSQDLVNIWEVAKANQQPSVTYVARMVAIESEVVLTEHEPVQTREFKFGTLRS